MKKITKYIIIILTILLIPIIINFYVILSTKSQIVDNKDITTNIDYIVVLGAGIRNNRPSPMLEDRLKTSIKLYNNGISDKIILTGDHQSDDYDEVTVMLNYLLENNIPKEDIILDNYGISTYDSIYRLKYIYKANNIVIVTQKYHLYRALYIANKLDIEAIGVTSNLRSYYGQSIREVREILARDKDFIKTIYKPESKYIKESMVY